MGDEDLGQDQHTPSPPRFCDPESALRQALADRSTEYGQISLPANYLAEHRALLAAQLAGPHTSALKGPHKQAFRVIPGPSYTQGDWLGLVVGPYAHPPVPKFLMPNSQPLGAAVGSIAM
ncbi:hypothetical protein PL81_01005 [Streptomyces sp. RSD-27]|nr:hypothetical protein PL81_01005 [Streptomyces sp. RSD-27]